MPFQATNQAVGPKKQANHQIAFDAHHDGVSRQMSTSLFNEDDNFTIDAGSHIVHYKNVEERRQSSSASSIKTRATAFFHALYGRPANAG